MGTAHQVENRVTQVETLLQHHVAIMQALKLFREWHSNLHHSESHESDDLTSLIHTRAGVHKELYRLCACVSHHAFRHTTNTLGGQLFFPLDLVEGRLPVGHERVQPTFVSIGDAAHWTKIQREGGGLLEVAWESGHIQSVRRKLSILILDERSFMSIGV